MAVYSFGPGVAYAVATIGDEGAGIDFDTGFAVNVTASTWADASASQPVVVRDVVTGNPTVVRSGSTGTFAGFLADDVPIVYLKWSPNLPAIAHFSDQAINASAQVEEAKAAAAAAQVAAEAAGGGGLALDPEFPGFYRVFTSGTLPSDGGNPAPTVSGTLQRLIASDGTIWDVTPDAQGNLVTTAAPAGAPGGLTALHLGSWSYGVASDGVLTVNARVVS